MDDHEARARRWAQMEGDLADLRAEVARLKSPPRANPLLSCPDSSTHCLKCGNLR